MFWLNPNATGLVIGESTGGGGGSLSPDDQAKLDAQMLPVPLNTPLNKGDWYLNGQQILQVKTDNLVVTNVAASITANDLGPPTSDAAPPVDISLKEPRPIEFNADGDLDLSVGCVWQINPKGARRAITTTNGANVAEIDIANVGERGDRASITVDGILIRGGHQERMFRNAAGNYEVLLT